MENIDNYFTKRYRPYDYQENLIREKSRKRGNRKQLCFTDDELNIIETNMKELGIDNFSYYMRAMACFGNITKEEIEIHSEELQ